MSELYYQKVVSSSSDGKLEVFDQEALDAYLQGLFKMPKTLEVMAELIEFGQKCIGDRADALALRVFENAYHSLGSLPCTNERKLEFAQLVREGLGNLNQSQCEFVWEETGELLRACEELIKSLEA